MPRTTPTEKELVSFVKDCSNLRQVFEKVKDKNRHICARPSDRHELEVLIIRNDFSVVRPQPSLMDDPGHEPRAVIHPYGSAIEYSIWEK